MGEFHILLALCKAAPQLQHAQAAEQLLHRISPYVLEAHEQVFDSSPFLRTIEPSPWEALSYNLISSSLALGLKHPSLHDSVYDTLVEYLTNSSIMSQKANASSVALNGSHDQKGKPYETVTLAMSITGCLDAMTEYMHFFTAVERINIVTILRGLLSDGWMVALEGSLSSIRNSEPSNRAAKDLKFFCKRYASSGRPLGAMLLQYSFLRLLVASSALQITVADNIQQSSILDFLTPKSQFQLAPRRDYNADLLELSTEISAEIMRVLDDGADYLELGSSWQQRLALKVRGQALTVFLLCMLLDEEVADADVIMSWLETSLADPVQMAHDELARVILKSLTIVAKTSPSIATTLSRSLPRFIVQGQIQGPTLIVAGQCLASILQSLSQDAVISALYTLGNVLTAANADKGATNYGARHASSISKGSARYTHHATGSAISLGVSGEEETLAVFVNVVRAVVTIAKACGDEKVISLAQSMLLQKYGRVSLTVDLQIIIETAFLGAIGDENDLKSLLRLYDRLAHDAVTKDNTPILEAVCEHPLVENRLLTEDADCKSTN